MRFGVQLGWQDAAQLRDTAQAAEGLGFDAVYFPDHLVHEGPERQRMVSQTLFTVMVTDGAAATRANAEMFAGMLGLPPEEVLRSPLTLIGTPEECVAELQRRRREWGVAETIISGRSEDLVRRLAEEVIPRV